MLLNTIPFHAVERPYGLKVGEKEYKNLGGGDFLALLASYIDKAGINNN